MLRPAPMVKINLSGLLDQLERTTHVLEELSLVHLLAPHELEDGFDPGRPLGYGARVSELLLEIRGLQKVLEVEEGDPTHPYPGPELAGELDSKLHDIEGPIRELRDNLVRASSELEAVNSAIERLSLFQDLGLGLEDLSGYDSLEVVMGDLPAEGLAALEREGLVADSIVTERLTIIFIPADRSEEAAQLLSQHGFKPVEPPFDEGDPGALMAHNRRRANELTNELEALRGEREALATRHGTWLAAAEEYLSIEAGKSELPMSLTTSAHTFVLEGWVPETEVGRLEARLAPLGLHLEYEAPADLELAGVTLEPAADDDAEALAELRAEPPVKLDNPRPVSPFELFIRLFNTPRHHEVDPSLLLFIAYPLFFGLMVGDSGYGVGYFLLGTWLARRFHYHEQLEALGKIMRLAGLWTIFFGLFVYAEAFGMTFVEMGERLGFTFHWPYHTLHKFDKDYVLLMISVCLVIGGMHLTLGLLTGFRNKLQHHTLAQAVNEKISWILIIWAFIVLLMVMMKAVTATAPMGFILVGMILLGVVMIVAAEGGIAVLELPTALSNIISYTRILALGLSDAGLAFAFNKLALDVVGGGGGVMLLGALLVLLMGHLLIFALGIIGSGIHSLRLQYVEFFTKFYEGGGTPFTPFGFKRQYITSNSIQS